jgi:hypothetical protein
LQEAKVAEEDHDMMAGIKTEAVSSILLDRHFMTGACRTYGYVWNISLTLAFDDIQKVIKDTFSLEGTPKEALYLGMAGVIPYLATSLETVYLSYEINRATATGDGLIFSGQTAELMLHMLEPIQVGYGAVVSLNLS